MPEKLLGVFDLETTGIDVESDRVVTAFIGTMNEAGEWVEKWSWLVNPGIPIPESASNVHGITDEMVLDAQRPYGAIYEIMMRLDILDRAGIPVGGMNLTYDFTLLDREVRRHLKIPSGLRPPRVVLDAMVIDKKLDPYRKGGRKLVNLAPVYKVPVEANAHDAQADCLMAGRILLKMLKHPWLITLKLEDIHRRQIKNRRDQQLSLLAYFEKTGKAHDAFHVEWPLIPLPGAEGDPDCPTHSKENAS